MNKSYSSRKYVIISIFVFIGLLFLFRLFLLQVVDNEYKLSAQSNVLRHITQYPGRGLIYDRNEELLVYNEAAYDLLVIPGQVKKIDTTTLCKLLKITTEDYIERITKAKRYSYKKPSVFLEQISKEDYGFLEEQLYKFRGFFVQARTLRKYPIPIAAHILGYIGEVDQNNISKNPYYRSGDYIGKSGIEKFYENTLRGTKGLKIKMVDVFNREKGSYQDGKYDSTAVAGSNLFLSIDWQLQQYGEKLMQNKKGSIVAIEPKSGEILAMVSAPYYDPNLLIGRVRGENFAVLRQDSLEPLFNRSTMAQYPPGSTFKLINTVIALNDGVLKRETKYECQGTTSYPLVCSHNHYSPLDLHHAIEQSCNPYFYKVYKSLLKQPTYSTIQEAYTHWVEQVSLFGVGQILKSDLGNQRDGNLPPHTYFDHYYGKKGWKAITIRSLAVGQGEIELTPLQMANVTAIIANRGYYYPPHIVKGVNSLAYPVQEFNEKIETGFAPQLFEEAIAGMHLVYEGEHGSARWYRVDTLQMCGKTGTAENPHGKSHSVFIAFAPKDDPQIAISVLIENAGFGATWAAPIASLMIEKYILGEVKPKWYEDKMLNSNLINKKE